MELKQVKSILHQTKCGEMFMDGMGCSEPILTHSNKGLVDNFFVYLVNKRENTVTGPLARIGLYADSETLAYLISCEEKPFSVSPKESIPYISPLASAHEHEEYSSLYGEIRKIAFKEFCSESERATILRYVDLLQKIVSKSLYRFYKESAPEFFEWVRKQTS